jgi:hypothetical protein
VTAGAEDAAVAAALVPTSPTHTDEVLLPDALPAFLEACGKLAAEAARRGDLRRAHELTELAARAAGRD